MTLVTTPAAGARSRSTWSTSRPRRRTGRCRTGDEPDHGHVPDRQRHHDRDREHVRQRRDRGQRRPSWGAAIGVVATCSLNGGQTIPGGHQLRSSSTVSSTHAAGPQTLSVKTTSDLPATASGTYNIQTGGQISQPAVTLSNHAPGAAGVQYFDLVHDLVAERDAVELALSQITVTFPTGSDITTALREHVRQGRDREQRDRRGVQQIGGGRDLQPQRRPDRSPAATSSRSSSTVSPTHRPPRPSTPSRSGLRRTCRRELLPTTPSAVLLRRRSPRSARRRVLVRAAR